MFSDDRIARYRSAADDFRTAGDVIATLCDEVERLTKLIREGARSSLIAKRSHHAEELLADAWPENDAPGG